MNRRMFLRTLGAVGAAALLPLDWVGKQVAKVPDYQWFNPTVVRIAAANSSIASKATAHFIATGGNDQHTFDLAFSVLDKGGTILLSEGVYHLPDGLKGPDTVHHWSIQGSPNYESIIRGD